MPIDSSVLPNWVVAAGPKVLQCDDCQALGRERGHGRVAEIRHKGMAIDRRHGRRDQQCQVAGDVRRGRYREILANEALVAKKYSLNPREPWLLIAETVVTAAGQRILYAEDYHRGSSFAFNVLRRP